MMYDTHAPLRLVIRIMRRPYLSLSRPQNGADRNWNREYAPRIGVIHCGGMPKRSPM